MFRDVAFSVVKLERTIIKHITILVCSSSENLENSSFFSKSRGDPACSSVPVFRCFGVSVFRCFGVSVFRCSGVPVFQCSGGPVVRWSGVPVFRCSGVPVFRCSIVPDFNVCLARLKESNMADGEGFKEMTAYFVPYIYLRIAH